MGKHRRLVEALSQRLEKLEKSYKRRRHSSSDDSCKSGSSRRTRSLAYRRRSPSYRRRSPSYRRRSPTPRSQTRHSRTPHRSSQSPVSEHNLGVTSENPVQTTERGGVDMEVEATIELVPEIEGLLGQEGTFCAKKPIELHAQLVQRWQAILKDGIKKETKDSIMEKYNPQNILIPPKLNEEVAAAMNESGIKRDKRINDQQAALAMAVTAIGKVMNKMITDSQKSESVEALSDAARILCDLHHDNSITRRALILPGLNKDLKELMERTPISEFLFGDKLQERVTACKAVKKSAQELKNTPAKPTIKAKGNLNFRGPQRQMPRPSGPRPKVRRITAPTVNRPRRSPQRQQHHHRRQGRSHR